MIWSRRCAGSASAQAAKVQNSMNSGAAAGDDVMRRNRNVKIPSSWYSCCPARRGTYKKNLQSDLILLETLRLEARERLGEGRTQCDKIILAPLVLEFAGEGALRQGRTGAPQILYGAQFGGGSEEKEGKKSAT